MLSLSAEVAAVATGLAQRPLYWEELGLSPIALDLGFFTLKWYSLAYLFGILLGYLHLSRMIKAPGAPMAQRHADDLFFYATLGIILGGRMGYVLFYAPAQFAANPAEIFKLWEGGMSFHGGLIGTVLAIAWVTWRGNIPFLRTADYIAVCTPFGLLLGRLANFVNGELWGRAAESQIPWAMVFPGAGPAPRHPSQLYEAGLEGVALFLILWLAVWKWRLLTKPGYVTGLFLFGYGLARASLENFRQPDFGMENLPLGLTMGMMLSIPMMLVGAWLIWRAWSRPPVAA